LTTPLEIFSIDKTVIISRGLLNLVPDESTLAGLLALEIAHITLGHSRSYSSVSRSLFDPHRNTDFPGFGIRRTVDEEKSAGELMQSLLKGTTYSGSADQVESFLRGVARLSSNVPHLTSGLGRFNQVSFRAKQLRVSLQLRGDYGINSWESQVVTTHKTPHGESATAIIKEPERFSAAAAPDQ